MFFAILRLINFHFTDVQFVWRTDKRIILESFDLFWERNTIPLFFAAVCLHLQVDAKIYKERIDGKAKT